MLLNFIESIANGDTISGFRNRQEGTVLDAYFDKKAMAEIERAISTKGKDDSAT